MKPWAQIDRREYDQLDLRAHSLLHDAPLHDVWRVDLPGGGPGRTVADLRDLSRQQQVSGPTKLLFALRTRLGRVFGWDRTEPDDAGLFKHRLTDQDHAESIVKSGTMDGPFTVLYLFPREAASEIRNGTVHAALVWALTPLGDGYRLFWGIYVKPVGSVTRVYMALIGPFRRWIVYPSLLRRLHHAWCRQYAPEDGGPVEITPDAT